MNSLDGQLIRGKLNSLAMTMPGRPECVFLGTFWALKLEGFKMVNRKRLLNSGLDSVWELTAEQKEVAVSYKNVEEIMAILCPSEIKV